MSATHNTDTMSEFRDYVVISSWTNTVSPAMQDMLRLTTDGTDFMQEFLSTENQYRTALSVLSSAGATRDATLPELSDAEKLRVQEPSCIGEASGAGDYDEAVCQEAQDLFGSGSR